MVASAPTTKIQQTIKSPAVQNDTTHRVSRRRALFVAASAAAGLTVGCRQSSELTSPTESNVRTDVALRVVFCGSEREQETLSRNWAAVNPQQLAITRMDVDRAAAGGLARAVAEASASSDVIVAPLFVVAELEQEGLVVPLSEKSANEFADQHGPLFASLRNGVALRDGQFFAIPLGARQPALISAAPIEGVSTWKDYDRWVESVGGRAGEPLADGWAGTMFLWRAAETIEDGWLLDREQLEPRIDSAPFQQVLTQMKLTADRYSNPRMTPAEIWGGIRTGELDGGITFPVERDSEPADDLVFADPPADGPRRLMLDPFSPVALIAETCRQTAASKRLVRWMCGGEESSALRREIDGMTVTRRAQLSDADGGAASGYERWLFARLKTPQTLPSVELFAGDEYYAALDRSIVRCLTGELDPGAALAEVKQAWSALTERIGMEKQRRVWRRSNR